MITVHPWFRSVTAAALLCATACTGRVGDPPYGEDEGGEPSPGREPGRSATPTGAAASRPGASAPPPASPGTPPATRPEPGPFVAAEARLRKLTERQLRNSLRDLLGDGALPPLGSDVWLDGFASIAATHGAYTSGALERYAAALDTTLGRLFADAKRRDAWLGCTPTAANVATCARAFVERFGRLAWRRPLGPAEITRKSELAIGIATAANDPALGLRSAAAALLESPHFLYRDELGEPDPSRPGGLRHSSLEMASRLSFTLLGTTPDAALIEAGVRGELVDRQALATHVKRLVADARVEQGVRAFVDELFELERIADMAKDRTKFPQLTPALRVEMGEEVRRLFLDARADGDALALFDRPYTFVGPDLAKLYGVAAPSTMSRVDLPASGMRGGLMTASALLALHARTVDTSPSGRGRMVNQLALCRRIPDPPADVDNALPPPSPAAGATTRERLAVHRQNPACKGCHDLLDPPGLALETFDALGAVRTKDEGKPIDPSGVLDGVAFAGPRELGAALRKHPDAASCMARQLFRYATGHLETDGERASLEAITRAFVVSGHRFPALLEAVVTSDAFRLAAASPR